MKEEWCMACDRSSDRQAIARIQAMTAYAGFAVAIEVSIFPFRHPIRRYLSSWTSYQTSTTSD